jgi:hypothetical protein
MEQAQCASASPCTTTSSHAGQSALEHPSLFLNVPVCTEALVTSSMSSTVVSKDHTLGFLLLTPRCGCNTICSFPRMTCPDSLSGSWSPGGGDVFTEGDCVMTCPLHCEKGCLPARLGCCGCILLTLCCRSSEFGCVMDFLDWWISAREREWPVNV